MLPIKLYTPKRIFRYYNGLSFFVFIWICRLEKNEERLARHETIHFWQQVEMLFVFHWLFYVIFYFISRGKGHGHYIAYRYNPFELEAYANDHDVMYLKKRKPYAWIKHIRGFAHSLTKKFNHPGEHKIGW